MAAQPARQSNAELIREIATLALGDANEIIVLIELMQQQNASGVNNKLSAAGAGRAAIAVRNAFIARLVLLIARAYPRPRKGDKHLAEAARLLKTDNVTRQIFGSGDDKKLLAEFEAHWMKCRGDHRQERLKHFRDKYTAHLGEPKQIQEATFRELHEFGAETARLMELLALVARVAAKPIKSDPDLVTVRRQRF